MYCVCEGGGLRKFDYSYTEFLNSICCLFCRYKWQSLVLFAGSENLGRFVTCFIFNSLSAICRLVWVVHIPLSEAMLALKYREIGNESRATQIITKSRKSDWGGTGPHCPPPLTINLPYKPQNTGSVGKTTQHQKSMGHYHTRYLGSTNNPEGVHTHTKSIPKENKGMASHIRTVMIVADASQARGAHIGDAKISGSCEQGGGGGEGCKTP